jgi:hypothetical protein
MSNIDVRNNIAFRNTNLGLEAKNKISIPVYENGAFRILNGKEFAKFKKLSDDVVVTKNTGQKLYSPKAEAIVTTITQVASKLSGAAGSEFNAALARDFPDATNKQLDKIADLKAEISDELQEKLKSFLLAKVGGDTNSLSNLAPITVKEIAQATDLANAVTEAAYADAKNKVKWEGRSKAKQAHLARQPKFFRQKDALMNAGRKAQTPPAQAPQAAPLRTTSSTSSAQDFDERLSTTASDSPRSDMIIDTSGEDRRSLSSTSLPDVGFETKTPSDPGDV